MENLYNGRRNKKNAASEETIKPRGQRLIDNRSAVKETPQTRRFHSKKNIQSVSIG